MKHFKHYCKEIKNIDGIKTCIVLHEYLDDVLSDLALLSVGGQPMPFEEVKRVVEYLAREANRNPLKIFLAFAELSNTQKTRVLWVPINCYKDGDNYYHVCIRDSWMCRECKQLNYGKFIMPMIEHDAVFYGGTNNKYPSIPPLFKKKKCIHCGKELQNHFIYADE